MLLLSPLLLPVLGSPGQPTLSTYWPLHNLSVCPSARLKFPLMCACLSVPQPFCPSVSTLCGPIQLLISMPLYLSSVYLPGHLPGHPFAWLFLPVSFYLPPLVYAHLPLPHDNGGPQNLGEQKAAQGRIEEGDFLLRWQL